MHSPIKRNVPQHKINTKTITSGNLPFTTSGLKREQVYSQRKRLVLREEIRKK